MNKFEFFILMHTSQSLINYSISFHLRTS